MTQIFFPSQVDGVQQQVYCYFNNTSKMAIVRILGLEERHCERVVFPGEKFLFEAEQDCELEVSKYATGGIVKENIPCSELQEV